MATLLIRSLDDALKFRLRVRAAENGRSMEEEARAILRQALAYKTTVRPNLAEAIRRRVEPLGGFHLEIAPREAVRELPELE